MSQQRALRGDEARPEPVATPLVATSPAGDDASRPGPDARAGAGPTPAAVPGGARTASGDPPHDDTIAAGPAASDAAGAGLGPATPARGAATGARARKGRWLTLLLAVVVGGLVLGALAAALSTPLRGTTRVAVTPLPTGGAGGRGGAATLGAEGPEGAGGAEATGRGAAGASTRGAAGGGPAGARGASAAGARTNGVIASIDGDTMVVSTPDGPVRVTLGDGTSVQRLAPAAREDLATGQRVVISGERSGDGAVAASGVQIVGEAGADAGTSSRGPGAAGPRGAGERAGSGSRGGESAGAGGGARAPGATAPGAEPRGDGP